MHFLTPFLGISFSFVIHFTSLNIIILFLKQANICHFYPILEHLLHLGQEYVTMETRNVKHDKIRRFLLIIGLCYMLQVFHKFKRL